MQVLSLVWGMLALLGLFVGFIPCLGALNWVNIPFALVGVIISAVAIAQAKIGAKGMAIAGVVMCSVSVVFGLFRLIIGGGIA